MIKKKCAMCGEELPLSQFAKHPKGKYERQGRCRECFAISYYQPKRKPRGYGKTFYCRKSTLPEHKSQSIKRGDYGTKGLQAMPTNRLIQAINAELSNQRFRALLNGGKPGNGNIR